MRSKLFVPGSRPELFAKALASSADAISIDLEDAVEESRKADARITVGAWLDARDRNADEKIIVVRTNAFSTPHFNADLEAIVGPNLDFITLPMVESPDEVRAAADAISRLENERGVASPIGLLVTVETPRGLRRAAGIAGAVPRIAGLQFGLADLFEPFGIDRSNEAAVQQIQLALRLAAGEAGVPAYDTAYADVQDENGYRREAETARRLGFHGKSCIHPSQVPLANEVFRPSDSEIAAALRVLEASRRATADGVGAYMVDGRMIDAPFARRAEDVVNQARHLGLLPASEAGSS